MLCSEALEWCFGKVIVWKKKTPGHIFQRKSKEASVSRYKIKEMTKEESQKEEFSKRRISKGTYYEILEWTPGWIADKNSWINLGKNFSERNLRN